MSERGLCSRREADEYIERGWVYVDGVRVEKLGTRIDPSQNITLDKRAADVQRVTILLHKPVGYVSGQAEDGYRPAITLITPAARFAGDSLSKRFAREHLRDLAPAGRLDIDSTGLLVFTQDGRIAKLLIGENSPIEKEYLVRVEGKLDDKGLRLLNHGLSLDGSALKPAQVSWQNRDQLRFVLREGKKRQIRRMCELVGLRVTGLKRVRIGRVTLGDLPPGQWRYLDENESFQELRVQTQRRATATNQTPVPHLPPLQPAATAMSPRTTDTPAANRSMIQRTLAAVWHPCTQMKTHETFPPLPVVSAEGIWLVDADGRRYLDGISSWWVNLFGHCNPRINAALRDQLDRLEHVMLAGFTHEPVIALSEHLSALTGGRLGHCFFASDGSSAVEIALKMSIHYWRNSGLPEKTAFIKVAGGYHGETLGALSVSDVAQFRDAYAPLLRESATVPSPDWRNARPGESAADCAVRAAQALDRHLDEHAWHTAAIIVEPLVQCAAGMAMHDPEYLRRVRAACDLHGIHFIADEIAVGFGRTGSFFAHEQAGVTPDFMTLSKGITGGYLPLSAVLTRDDIYDAFYADDVTRGFLHSHSYTGNALACRAALATLDIFAQDDVLAANRNRARLIAESSQVIGKHPRVSNLRQTGMITAFDVDTDDPAFSRHYHRAALEQGVLLRPIGKTVYFMPPYVITGSDIDHLVGAAQRALERTLF